MRTKAPLAACLLAACASAPDAGQARAERAPAGPEALVHVQRIAAGEEALWVDFAAIAPDVDDALAGRVLEPLLPRVADLSLARTRVTDATLASCARMPGLRRLDLRATAVTPAGLEALAGHPRLESLVLVETRLSTAAVAPLSRLPALRRLSVWQSGLTQADVASLRERLPAVAIDAGDRLETAVLAEEAPPQLTSDAPLPDGAKAKPKPAPAVNTLCPVSGKPVAAGHVLVDEGKTIGFCCEKCSAAFAKEPEKYRAALR